MPRTKLPALLFPLTRRYCCRAFNLPARAASGISVPPARIIPTQRVGSFLWFGFLWFGFLWFIVVSCRLQAEPSIRRWLPARDNTSPAIEGNYPANLELLRNTNLRSAFLPPDGATRFTLSAGFFP